MSNDLETTTSTSGVTTGLRLKMKVRFHQPVTVYALQIGGWLPLALTSCRMLLVDRNIVATLKAIAHGSARRDHEANNWWLKFLNSPHFTINPILYAMESEHRRIPSFDKFCCDFGDAANILKAALPKSNLIEFEEPHYRAAYQTVLDFGERYRRERAFLCRVVPLIWERHGNRELLSLESQILAEASNAGLEKLSLILIAALSCLYERNDGEQPMIGRNILKPVLQYSEEHIYNAISDVRALELLAIVNAFGKINAALCTRDKYLGAFWCAMQVAEPQWRGTTLTFGLNPDQELFPRLALPQIDELCDRLKR